MNSKPVRKSLRRIAKFVKHAPGDPQPVKVHKLRTGARLLEAALESFRLDPQITEERLLRDLGKLRKKAGKVRDMDVLTERALTLKAKPGEEKCRRELIKHLGARRAKYAKKLRSATRKVGGRLRRELKESWLDLKPVFEGQEDGAVAVAAEKSRAQAVAREVHLTEALCLPQRLNHGNLHPYRLKVKELRYVLQLEDRAEQKQFLKKLGEVKDAIGEWHDWEELIAIAKDVLDHGSKCKLLQDMKAASRAKYSRALKITKDMRKAYIKVAGPAAEPAAQTPAPPSVQRAVPEAPASPVAVAV